MTQETKKVGRPKKNQDNKAVKLTTTLPPELKALFHELGGSEWLKKALLAELFKRQNRE